MTPVQAIPILLALILFIPGAGSAQEGFSDDRLRPKDIFELENASDPRISPDGEEVVYVRTARDIMTDRTVTTLRTIRFDGSGHRALTTGGHESSPRWSPDGERLMYVSSAGDSPQLYLRWMDSGETARLTNLTQRPSHLTWSPDGRWIAFSMLAPKQAEKYAPMPDKPEGAKCAESPKVIDRLLYRYDGAGYLETGYRQIYVIPAEGGSPRRLTNGPWRQPDRRGGGLSWSADSSAIVYSANRREDAEYDPVNTELYRVNLEDRRVVQLTKRKGPDNTPAVSPDGERIAYTGFDDTRQWYRVTKLYVMDADGTGPRSLTDSLDRSVSNPTWSADSTGIYFQYDDHGETRIALADLNGTVETVAGQLGGISLGRPYPSGSFTASAGGRVAYTWTDPHHPAEVAVERRGDSARRLLTRLNDDVLGYKTLGAIEEIRFRSAHDEREIQGWMLFPPDFDDSKKYPLILEIHGGPVANYGPRFSAEMQLYASAGYVVLYVNPRGSDSYGEEFGNLIHHNYPGQDYDDLMSGVDAAVAKDYIDSNRLFITGGSGGGVLTAWSIGKTGRFRAAAVGKPVINWYSWALTADAYNYFPRYWFPGPPWEHAEHYMARSPISLVGNVTTPAMVITGEADYRTPMSESEQYYQALKLRRVDTALVRIPEASHNIAARPSRLIAKVAHVLEWFRRHDAGAE